MDVDAGEPLPDGSILWQAELDRPVEPIEGEESVPATDELPLPAKLYYNHIILTNISRYLSLPDLAACIVSSNTARQSRRNSSIEACGKVLMKIYCATVVR